MFSYDHKDVIKCVLYIKLHKASSIHLPPSKIFALLRRIQPRLANTLPVPKRQFGSYFSFIAINLFTFAPHTLAPVAPGDT